MKVSRILANVIPRIKPVADARWFSQKERAWKDVGKIILWEFSWRGQEWYIYKGFSFPYTDVAKAVQVRRIGNFHIWKGTYKH